MTAFTQALTAALLHFVWQGLLVGFLLWIVLLKKSPATFRYAASCTALAVLAALPVITTWTLYQRMQPTTEVVVAISQLTSAPLRPLPVPWQVFVQSWALPVWSLGVLVLSLRLAWGSKHVYTLRRRAEPAVGPVLTTVTELATRMGLVQPVRVMVSSIADGPSVVGWIRPVILLPSAAILGLSTQQLEAVLAHEIAHIKRFDYLVNLLQLLVETLLFYHPAVWWTSARVRNEREFCCDDLAVRSCGDALCYARALTKLERLRIVAPSMALGSTGGSLSYRIRRLLGVNTQEYGPSKLTGVLALCLGLACIAVNVRYAHGQSQQPPAPEAHPITARTVERDADRDVRVDAGGAVVLHQENVEYPREALEKGVEGNVIVQATLDASGNVSDAIVLSGPAELRKAALQSILQWHFASDVVGSTRQVSFEFQLPPRNGTTGGFRATSSSKDSVRASEQRLEILQNRVREMELSIEFLESQLTSENERDRSIKHKIEMAKMRLEETRRAIQESSRSSDLPGRRLRRIYIVGLSEAQRNELVSRLPARIGDTMSPELIERTTTVVRQFDEHLGIAMLQSEDGQVEIRITPQEKKTTQK
jgi:TonB family protein